MNEKNLENIWSTTIDVELLILEILTSKQFIRGTAHNKTYMCF